MKAWKVGDGAQVVTLISKQTNEIFAALSGDKNPVHFDKERMSKTQFKGIIANGIQGISSIGTAIVKLFVTDETLVIALEQHNSFIAPIRIGYNIFTTVTIDEVLPKNEYWLQCIIKDANTLKVLTSARFRVRVLEA